MPRPRKTNTDVSPNYEDAGLFRNQVCEVQLELSPIVRHNKRNDLVVLGYVTGDLVIEVLFAGRRAKAAQPLVAQLNALRGRTLRRAASRGFAPPSLETIRLPVWIEGSWRARFQTDETGWTTRSFHLVAARWGIQAPSGGPMAVHGVPPIG